VRCSLLPLHCVRGICEESWGLELAGDSCYSFVDGTRHVVSIARRYAANVDATITHQIDVVFLYDEFNLWHCRVQTKRQTTNLQRAFVDDNRTVIEQHCEDRQAQIS